ncbi:uncharacterized protein LOC128555374 [Mercenaria mercenaria]|uniref:uncharacterized protein LOC128555374 n=1 Tax=Mercenaria mercenaria TaxID=6596 RepID=UPI00234EE1EF|nr:uncharacterized protein LOC128555374 [Mercenaria mercenaria]
MDKKLGLILLLLVGADALLFTVISDVEEVVSFALDVYNFFDGPKQTTSSVNYDKIVKTISERIEMSTEKITFKVELEAHLTELRTASYAIQQLLKDMEHIAKTNNETKRQIYKTRFHQDFERKKSDIYTIKSLLTFTTDVSGISNTLLSLIVEGFDCGMSSIEHFQTYYMTLVSNAVALDMLNEKLSDNDLHDDALKEWQAAAATLFHKFQQEKDYCKSKFMDLVKSDFDQIEHGKELFSNNQQRYSYTTNDVLFLTGSYCARSLKKYDPVLKKTIDNDLIYAIFQSEELNVALDKELFKKLVFKTKFDDCIKDTGDVINMFDLLGYDLVVSVMFPEGQAEIFQDKDSSSKSITTSKYTTIVYLRVQQHRVNGTLTAKDFDVDFYVAPVPAEEPFKLLGLEIWKLGVIGGSVLVFFIAVVVLCICYCRRRRRRRRHSSPSPSFILY